MTSRHGTCHARPVVLLDAVGTLLHPEPGVVEVYFRAGQRHGSRIDRDTVAQRFDEALNRYRGEGCIPSCDGTMRRVRRAATRTNESRERRRWRRIVTYVFEDVTRESDALFDELWNYFAEPQHWRLYDDVPRAWQRWTDAGWLIGIASNFDDRLLRLVSRIHPLQEARWCFISSRLGFPKAHPRFYASIERRLGRGPRELLMVGDDPQNDIAAPRARGWNAIRIARHGPLAEGDFTDLEILAETLIDGRIVPRETPAGFLPV